MKLFDWFLSRPEKHQMVLGISLTDDMIRWVRLVRRSDNGFMSIEGHGYSPLAPDIVVHGSIQKPNELLRALLPLRVHAELPVAVALPIEATQVFKLSIILEPGIDPEKTIQEEIIAYIGRETTLVSADTLCEYEIIHASSTHAYIFGTLYPRSQVDAYKAIFERIGFKKSETLSIPASLARMHTDDQQHAYIIIDIGISVTHIALVLGTTVSLLQTIPVGEASLLNTIQSYLQVNEAEARKIYKRYGLMHTHREPELLVALHNTLNPVKKSIEDVLESWQGIYKHQVENSPVVEMVVLGDGAYGKGMLDYLRRISTLETRHLNVWRLFPEVHNVVPEIDWYDALRFAPAIAVALEKIRKN